VGLREIHLPEAATRRAGATAPLVVPSAADRHAQLPRNAPHVAQPFAARPFHQFGRWQRLPVADQECALDADRNVAITPGLGAASSAGCGRGWMSRHLAVMCPLLRAGGHGPIVVVS